MSREAMQAALDALIESFDAVHYEYTEALRLYEGIPTRKAKLARMKALVDKHESAIEQLEAALAAPEQEPVAYVYLDRWNSGRAWPDDCFSGTRCDGQVPVYLAAPVSGRVISDAEILDALRSIDVETKRLPEGLRLFARAIIAKVEGK